MRVLYILWFSGMILGMGSRLPSWDTRIALLRSKVFRVGGKTFVQEARPISDAIHMVHKIMSLRV